MVVKSKFGDYDLFTVSDRDISLSVMTLGAAVTGCCFKGKQMVLNYPQPQDYFDGKAFIGAAIGRYANRIGNAEFTLNGKKYALLPNENSNQLHGGPHSFDKRVWTAEQISGNSVKFSILSPDGDNGFPGNLKMSVIYSVIRSSVHIDFEAESDADTVFAPTVHPYFCLGSKDSPLLDAYLQINSGSHLEINDDLIPTGKILPAENEFDFMHSREIKRDYDDCFVLRDEYACSLEIGDILMELWTDMPAVQVYTGRFLPPEIGINRGIAIEPEFYPDSPNHPEFPSTVLKAGEPFRKWAEYKFYQK